LSSTFSRPVKSGWKPAPSSSSEPIRPPVATRPSVGAMIPAIRRSSVDLPDPFRPTAGRDAERDVAERPHLLRPGPAARDEQLLQRVRLARADDEPPRHGLDLDLARVHA